MESSVMEIPERRRGLERRSGADRRSFIKQAVSEAVHTKKRTNNTALEVAGSAAVAALGLGVYKATGLYDAADSGMVQVAIGAAIAWWFVTNFRVGLHMK